MVKRIFIPKFEGAIEGYVVNYLKRNYWRVEGFIEYKDLMQEARYLFLKLKQQYSCVDNAKWFMALFKTSFSNYINGLSNKRTERFSVEVEVESEIAENIMNMCESELDNQGHLACLIEQAPDEVRAVLSLLISAPKDLLEDVTRSWKLQGRRKNESNKHLCKLLGYDENDTDLIGSVVNYLSNN